MTNLGGWDFFVLVYGLFMTAGTPFVVLAWVAFLRYLGMQVVRAFLLVNAAVFVVGLVMVTLWSLPSILSDPTTPGFQYIFLYVGMAIAVIVLLEVLPLGIGILSTERFAGAPRTQAAYAAAGGWFVGAVLGIVAVALVSPGFLAVLGTIPGSIIGAAGLGPVLYRRFGRPSD